MITLSSLATRGVLVLWIVFLAAPAVGSGGAASSRTVDAATAAAIAADSSAVQDVMTKFEAALNTRDVDKLMATLVPSDDVTLFLPVPYAPMLIGGTAEARKAFEIFFQDLPKQAAFQVTRHQTVVQIHGDIAFGYTLHNYYLNRGDLPNTLIARTTMVFRKQDGVWRILHVHGGAVPDVKDYVPR